MKDLKRRLAVQGLRADDVEIFSATMQIERVFHVEQSAIHPTNRARAAQCFIWIMFHVEHAQEQQQYHPIYLTPMRNPQRPLARLWQGNRLRNKEALCHTGVDRRMRSPDDQQSLPGPD